MAAFALFVFHVREGHRLGLVTFTFFEEAPVWIGRVLERSYVATGLFFLLSGHVFARHFLVEGADGVPRLDRSPRAFFLRRVTRVWPLHAAVLLLLAPVVVWAVRQDETLAASDMVASGVASFFLVQAWFPSLVMSWNVPTWALSTVVAFYAAFALVAAWRPRWLRRLSRREAAARIVAALVIALVPAALVAALRADAPSSLSTGNDIMLAKFHPLVWMPIFFVGVFLARSPWSQSDSQAPCLTPGWGDAAWCLLIVLLAVLPEVPYLFARHGLAVPLLLVGVIDLERRRGVVAWVMSTRVLGALGSASFALFIVQLPVAGGAIASLTARNEAGLPLGDLALAGTLALTVSTAWVVSRVDRRVTGALRARLGTGQTREDGRR